MNNIELLILVSGIVLLAIINFYFCYYKEEQRNNKTIERNKIISLFNEIYRQIFELMKILENKTIERNKIISLCNEIYRQNFELMKILENKIIFLYNEIKQKPESEISSEIYQIERLTNFVEDIDNFIKKVDY